MTTVPIIFATQQAGRMPLLLIDEDFAFVQAEIDALTLLIGGGAVRVVTANAGVGAGDYAIAVNLAAPGAITLTLPPVATRVQVLPLYVFDWAGNATITLAPAAGETVMGLGQAVLKSAGQGAGTAAAVELIPSAGLKGWLLK